MFGLQDAVSGEFFDTKDVTISVEIIGPTFRGEDEKDGSLMLDMVLPLTDINKKLTGFLGDMDDFSNEVHEISVNGWVDGEIEYSGIMCAQFSRPDGIECTIGMGRGQFNYEAEGKMISDVVPDEWHYPGQEVLKTDPVSQIPHYLHDITEFDDIVNKVYPEVNLAVFPVKIDDMCSKLGSAYNNAYYNTTPCVNTWDMDAQKFLHPVLFGDFFSLIKQETDANTNTNLLGYLLAYNVFQPFVYNSWVFKNLFQSMGFFLENNPLETHPDLKKLVLFNVQTINKLWTEYAHYTGSPNTDRYLYALEPELKFNLKDHLPKIAVKDYLRALEDLFFFRCYIDNKSNRVKIVFLKDLVNSKEYDDITDRITGIKERKLDYDKISALVQTYDGADGNGSILKALSEIQAVDRIADVWDKNALPVNDQGQYTNKICYTYMEKKWYMCPGYSDDFTRVSPWEEFSYEYMLQLYCNKTGKEWKTEASGIVCTYFTDYKPGTSFIKWEWMIPYCKMPVKFYNADKTKDAECGMRLMFYRGLQGGKVQHYIQEEYVSFGYANAHLDAYIYLTASIYGYSYPEETANNIINYIQAHHLLVDVSAFFTHYGYPWSLITTYCVTGFENDLTSIENKRYPYGTNDVYDMWLQKIPEANLSLKWDGEYGIYERLAKEFVYFKNNVAKAETLYFQPTGKDFSFDFSKKKWANGIGYLIDRIRFQVLPGGTLSEGEMDGFSC